MLPLPWGRFQALAHRATMGSKITKLKPMGGCCRISRRGDHFFGLSLGIPVSTTTSLPGPSLAVGSVRGRRAVHWGVARRIVYAWVLTIPTAAGIAALAYS